MWQLFSHLPPAPEILVRMLATPWETRITTTVNTTPSKSQRISGTLIFLSTLAVRCEKGNANKANRKYIIGKYSV